MRSSPSRRRSSSEIRFGNPSLATAPDTTAAIPIPAKRRFISSPFGPRASPHARAADRQTIPACQLESRPLFTVEQRDALRERLLRLAEEDERAVAGAAVGSLAVDS